MLYHRNNPLFSLLAICLASALVLPCLASSSKTIYFVYTNNTQDTTKENILYWPNKKNNHHSKNAAQIKSDSSTPTLVDAPQNGSFVLPFDNKGKTMRLIKAPSSRFFIFPNHTTTLFLFNGKGCEKSHKGFITQHKNAKSGPLLMGSAGCFRGGGAKGNQFQWYWTAVQTTPSHLIATKAQR